MSRVVSLTTPNLKCTASQIRSPLNALFKASRLAYDYDRGGNYDYAFYIRCS
jgi:hypothetical protein